MVVELIYGVTKHPFLHIDGHLYTRSTERNGRVFWKCRKYPECRCRVVTRSHGTDGQDLEVLKSPEEHSHAPNLEEVSAVKLRGNLKRRAEAHPEAPPAQLLRTELHAVPSGVLSQHPERPNLVKAIQRKRTKNIPTNPQSLEDFEDVPEKYKHTLGGEIFLLYDSYNDDDADESVGRLLVWATKENLRRLARSTTWFVDGTFKVVPIIFFQLFAVLAGVSQIINGVEKKVALPVVYALMENKTQKGYEKVFKVIKEACDQFGYVISATMIMTDFELGIIRAAETLNILVKACFFHLRQSVYRRIQSEGLQNAYNDPQDRSIKEAAQMMCATAFVPLNDVYEAFDKFMEGVPENLIDIAEYFEDNYIRGKPARGRRRATQPRYHPELWNMYEAVKQNMSRTNNLSEGWHNRFAVVVGKDHPSLYMFLVELQKEQGDTEAMFRELDVGRKIKRSENLSRIKTEERLYNVVKDYETRKEVDGIVQYLRNVGHYITF